MRTELAFLDTTYESYRSIMRTVIAFELLLIFSLFWYKMNMETFYHSKFDNVIPIYFWIGLITITFLISSIIAIQIPKNAKTSLIYGMLIGLVIYGCINAVLLMTNFKWTVKTAIIDIIYGIISTSIVAFIVYKVFF